MQEDHKKTFISTAEVARHTGFSASWLVTLRRRGDGPAYIKCGRRVLYDSRDIETWLLSHRVSKS